MRLGHDIGLNILRNWNLISSSIPYSLAKSGKNGAISAASLPFPGKFLVNLARH
jgi:hypothetical protein